MQAVELIRHKRKVLSHFPSATASQMVTYLRGTQRDGSTTIHWAPPCRPIPCDGAIVVFSSVSKNETQVLESSFWAELVETGIGIGLNASCFSVRRIDEPVWKLGKDEALIFRREVNNSGG